MIFLILFIREHHEFVHRIYFRDFFEIFILAQIWANLVPKLWGSPERPKVIRLIWNFVHLFLGWIPGGVFFIFLKFSIPGVLNPKNQKTLGQDCEPNICHLRLKFDTLKVQINTWGCVFHFFKFLISWNFMAKKRPKA